MKFHPPNKIFTDLYRRFLYRLAGGSVLLLTTRGRKTGKLHTNGLQYELINGGYYVGAADGERADWYRNLLHNPRAKIQAGEKIINVSAEMISDTERIADFLEYRIKKHPLMIRLIMRLDGVKGKTDRSGLLSYAARIRMVILTPAAPDQS
jgi:deazaflavin-dependent oxidoreductase (nitroreductase family)